MTLSEFFFDLPIYKKAKIDRLENLEPNSHIYYNRDELNIQTLKHILNKNRGSLGNIVGYNPIQKYESSFILSGDSQNIGVRTIRTAIFIEDVHPIIEQGGVVHLELQCKRSGDHFHFLVYWNPDKNTLTKVGQFPSYADIHRHDTTKYNSVLDEDKMNEFVRAIGLHASGVGIGAFVYLRRIFEYLIRDAYNALAQNTDNAVQDFERSRMDEKISMLKDYLPEFLIQNKNIYSILSKGIHELSEEDCLDYFNIVQRGIKMILDQKLEMLMRKKEEDEIKRELAELASKLSRS